MSESTQSLGMITVRIFAHLANIYVRLTVRVGFGGTLQVYNLVSHSMNLHVPLIQASTTGGTL